MFKPLKMNFRKRDILFFGIGMLTMLTIGTLLGAKDNNKSKLESCQEELYDTKNILDNCEEERDNKKGKLIKCLAELDECISTLR